MNTHRIVINITRRIIGKYKKFNILISRGLPHFYTTSIFFIIKFENPQFTYWLLIGHSLIIDRLRTCTGTIFNLSALEIYRHKLLYHRSRFEKNLRLK